MFLLKDTTQGSQTRFWRSRTQCPESGPEVINCFMLNSVEHKFILLINVKMPTIVGILTFISMINTTSERECSGSVVECLTRDQEFEPHLRHCVVVLEQDTFILAWYWYNPGRTFPVYLKDC